MNRPNSQIKSLLDAWDVFLRFRWRFILPAFLVTSAVLGASLLVPRKYEGEAIFERRTDMVLSEIMQRGGSPAMPRHQQSLNQQLAGAPAIDKLTRQMEPFFASKAVQDAGRVDAEQFRSDLERQVIVRYDIASNTLDRVRVTYIAHNPLIARMVVNGLVANYIDKTRQEINDRLAESARFFEAEVARCQQTIEKIENQKLEYEIKHGSLLPDSPNNLQLTLSEAQALLAEARSKHEAAVLRVKALQQSLAATPSHLPTLVTQRNPELRQLDDRLRELRKTESQYISELKMKPRHPDLVQLQAEIEQLTQAIAKLPAEVVTQERKEVNPQHGQLSLMLTQAKVEEENYAHAAKLMQQRVAGLETRSEDFFPVRAEYRRISREVEQHQRQLAFWEDNLRRVRMAMTAESGNRGILLDFIKPCEAITLPTSPNMIQVFMAAVLLGAIAGGVNVVMAYRADESFHEGQELSGEFNLPLMGSVSELISTRQRRLRRLTQMIVYPVNAAAMASVVVALGVAVYVNLRQPRQLPMDAATPVQAHNTPATPAKADHVIDIAGKDAPTSPGDAGLMMQALVEGGE